ncbi:uncharacterized protein Dana_GF14657 [Drosophila ananassae]|uniref:BPTI/Kunitz inhibitor domain-containing protein n=1 Tax=Drosophila ananassae TaxID=7217 RepID=B3MP49_DROAN|nr:boophilin-G2 [Drosophila ananassae]EDV31215.1 uncharacterized protein Dana_GF14657 [Drosophila ananassae]
MKYFGVIVMVLCFLGAALAQRKNPICAQEFGVIGHCRGLLPHWSYNQESGQCLEFNYSGCGGSDNRFETQEACEQNCKPQIL